MKRWLRWLLVALLFLVLAAGCGYWWLMREMRPLGTAFLPQLVRMRESITAEEVAQMLAKRELVRNPGLLAWWLKRYGKEQITPGDYEFSPDMDMRRIADILIQEQFTPNWVTFPEGWTRFKIANRLQERGIADAEEFLSLCRQPKKYTDIGISMPEKDLEGYLFPNTYRLPPGSGAELAVRSMLSGFKRYAYEPLKDEIDKSDHNLHQILTVASMIEKEAMHDKDRPLIAAVIYNRLKKGMHLQIDATVLYGMGQWKDRVLYRDLRHPSPYNTYLNKGLPPGPIANPGLASLKAALEPADVDYLFYVAQADGYHRFTKTYSNHLKAIAEIRQMRMRVP
jgi:UPF0755 protein